MREHIKEVSMSDLKDFLEHIRRLSSKIGEVAMRHVSSLFLKTLFYCLQNNWWSFLLLDCRTKQS